MSADVVTFLSSTFALGCVLADAAAQYASVAHALGFDLEKAVLALRGAMSVPATPFAGS